MISGKKVIWLLLFFALSKIILAENSPQLLNKWINYTDLKNVVSISYDRSAPYAYCATTGGLYVVDLSQRTVVKKYTNIDGLLNNNLTSVYVDTLDRLWIGAADGSIVIHEFSNGKFRYIYDIKNSSENNKSINDFVQYGGSMFIATGYGIQKISVANLNFLDAPYYTLGIYTTKSKVVTLSIKNDTLYAGTAVGIAYARITNNNLNNPASWENYSSSPFGLNIKSSEVGGTKVFFCSETGMGYFENGGWVPNPNPATTGKNVIDIRRGGNNLYYIVNNTIYVSSVDNLNTGSIYGPSDSYLSLGVDNAGGLLAGVNEKGLMVQSGSSQFEYIFPDCPNRNSFDNLSIDGNGILWAAGGQTDAGFYKFDGLKWEAFTTQTRPEIGTSNWFRRIVAGENKVWALSFGGGATLIDGNTIKNYNTSNSVLPGSDDPNFCVPFGGAFDNFGYFWMSFFKTNNATGLYKHVMDSVFFPYPNPSIINNTNFGQVAIDNYNTKWIESIAFPGGLYFFNDNGTDTLYYDDVYGVYYANDFEGNTVTGVIVDKNNEVWVSTNNGVFIIRNPLAAIQNPNQKPPAEKLGIISGNLKVPFTENCRCISTDVLNQKWIGTENNGVFHLSSDGSTLIETFNVTNSPLLSNQINSIAVSNQDGRAYFGTLNGLSSVQTDAIVPLKEFDKIVCSPNPFVLPSRVNLKIDGLIENTSVKILSISGDVMAEFDSPGGRIASWDGKDKKGKYVPSGIYLVVGFDKDGKKVGKGKLAVVKQ